VHPDGARQELSAQADITVSQPRFQSPWLGVGPCSGCLAALDSIPWPRVMIVLGPAQQQTQRIVVAG
jgi:hypothetical protein